MAYDSGAARPPIQRKLKDRFISGRRAEGEFPREYLQRVGWGQLTGGPFLTRELARQLLVVSDRVAELEARVARLDTDTH